MIFATPLGLLALLAIPAIIVIHLFRRRFPPRPVAGLFLWQTIRQTPEGGGKVSRLPITTSLILECLAALAFALVLAGARCSPAGVSEHLVVLLDDSASMSAANARGESARDRGVRRVLAELERLGPRARVTLIRSGDRPAVIAGPAAVALEAPTALEQWRPQAAGHSLATGIRLARELAGRTAKLMVVSDAPLEPAFEGGLSVSTGEPLANVGITAAHRTLVPEDGRGIVSLTLANYSNEGTRRRLTIAAGGKEIAARDLEIPNGVSSLTLPLPTGLPIVHVALSDDALPRDNAVVLAEPRPQIVAVENRIRGSRGREALAKALAALSGVTTVESGHLAFVDAADLEKPPAPGAWRVGFGEPPAAWRAPGAVSDLVGPFVLEKRHALLQGVTLGGVVWTGAMPVAPAAIRPVASSGDRTLIGTSATTASGDESILVNLDLDRTNLIRAPDWPILISNIVEMRRVRLPGPERWNYRVGEWVRVRLARQPQAPLRFRCGAVERTLPASRELEFAAPSPGGTLEILEGDQVILALGVNFLDESEPDLRARRTLDNGAFHNAAPARFESGPGSDPLFWVLLFTGGAALLLNWCLPSLRPRRA